MKHPKRRDLSYFRKRALHSGRFLYLNPVSVFVRKTTQAGDGESTAVPKDEPALPLPRFLVLLLLLLVLLLLPSPALAASGTVHYKTVN